MFFAPKKGVFSSILLLGELDSSFAPSSAAVVAVLVLEN